MGIERFFNSLKKVGSMSKEGIILGIVEKLDANYLYIDFNSIIYNIASDIEHELNYLLYSIILLNKGTVLDAEAIGIASTWGYDITSPSIATYKSYFDGEKIDVATIERVKNHVLHISSKLVIPEKLKRLFIALDGVPQMSKIIEQKKRRYNGHIISKLKKKIFLSYHNLMSNERKIYEENKNAYDRGKIISWADFMTRMLGALSSTEFKDAMKLQNVNLDEIIISHQSIYGEGEKKIMEHIIESKSVGYDF